MRGILGRGSRTKHLLTGVYLSVLVLAVTSLAVKDASLFLSGSDPYLSLAFLGLILGMAFTVVARLERFWVPIVMVPVGVFATTASVVYRVATNPGQPAICAIVRIARGFPLQYDLTSYVVGPRCIGSLLPLLFPQTNRAAFSLDVVFYVAVGLAIIQLCRGTILPKPPRNLSDQKGK